MIVVTAAITARLTAWVVPWVNPCPWFHQPGSHPGRSLARWPWLLATSSVIGGLLPLLGDGAAIAQVIPDDTLGNERSQVVGSPTQLEIQGGAVRGANLFHSFTEFNVTTGGQVYFANPTGIENILSRITGNTASTIDGLLGVHGAANLFLLNPHGIVFGPNAQLDLRGAFTASTAEGIPFADGSVFSATLPGASPLLSISVPLGVQFGGPPQGDITQAGALAVAPGQPLTLFGDTVWVSGSLAAPGGDISLLGNQILLTDQAVVDASGVTGGGTVRLGGDYQGQGNLPTATQTYVGPEVTLAADALETGNGGLVVVWADEVTQFYGTISAQGGMTAGNGGMVEISSPGYLDMAGQVDTTAPQGTTGTLLLDPLTITVINTPGNTTDTEILFGEPPLESTIQAAVINNATSNVLLQATEAITFSAPIAIAQEGIGLTAETNGDIVVNQNITTNGGDIAFSADTVSVTNARIRTNGGGSPGDITVTANTAITLDNGTLLTSANGPNNSGDITMTIGNPTSPGSLTLVNGSRLEAGSGRNTSGTSQGGTIDINTNGGLVSLSDSRIQSGTLGAGQGGGILINTGVMDIRDSSRIATGSIANNNFGSSTGNAGDIAIVATESLSLEDSDILAVTGGEGAGGNIDITTGALSLTTVDNQALGNRYDGRARIDVGTGGSGNAGNLTISADTVSLDDSLLLGGSLAGGNGGNITLVANELTLDNESVISSSADLENRQLTGGNAGDVVISTTGAIALRNGSTLASETTGTGNAGSISLGAGGAIELSNGSTITSQTSGTGNAGEIQVGAAGNLSISGGSSISSETTGTGNAGNVTVGTAGNFLLTGSSSIRTETSGFGDAGDVQITAGGRLEVSDQSFLSTDSSPPEVENPTPVDPTEVVPLDFTGAAGNIILVAGADLILSGNSRISSETQSNGAAGNIALESRNGNLNVDSSSLTSRTLRGGSAGSISLTTGNGDITLANGTGLVSSTVGAGNAGSIALNANGNITLINNTISLNDDETLDPLSGLVTGTRGSGNANAITLTATENITIDTTGLFSATNETGGNAGAITLTAGDTILIRESFVDPASGNFNNVGGLLSGTLGDGDAGTVSLRAGNAIALENSNLITGTDGTGNGGSINLWANQNITLANSQLETATQGSAEGSGDAGSIALTAQTGAISLVNGSQINSSTTGSGDASNIVLSTSTLNILEGSLIRAETTSIGDAGSITVTPTSASPSLTMTLGDGSSINASTTGTGAGGAILVVAPGNVVIQGANSGSSGEFQGTLSAETRGPGAAGNLTLAGNNVTVQNGVQISTATAGTGLGGNLTITSPGDVTIQNNSELSSASRGAGQAGSLTILADDLVMQNQARASVSSTAVEGDAGSITITANSILLNAAELTATTNSSGGNILLSVEDVLLLRNGSAITAQAQGSGDGGNITINAESGFVVAVPGENSDILATAEGGQGGRIIINASRILGFTEAASDLAISDIKNLRNNRTNDISASSGAGLEGEVDLNNLAIDPGQGLVELPLSFTDVSNQIAQGCQEMMGNSQSSLVVTGRGGLPPAPGDLLTGEAIAVPWVTPGLATAEMTAPSPPPQAAEPLPSLVEAQGWLRGANGEILFVADGAGMTLVPITEGGQVAIAGFCSPPVRHE